MFDFCVRRAAVRSTPSLREFGSEKAAAGRDRIVVVPRRNPSGVLSDWSPPVQIMTAEDRGWHRGPWKPSLEFEGESKPRICLLRRPYRTTDPGPFPFAFTLGCLELICLRICFPTPGPTFADSDNQFAVIGPHAILQKSAFTNRPIYSSSYLNRSTSLARRRKTGISDKCLRPRLRRKNADRMDRRQIILPPP